MSRETHLTRVGNPSGVGPVPNEFHAVSVFDTMLLSRNLS